MGFWNIVNALNSLAQAPSDTCLGPRIHMILIPIFIMTSLPHLSAFQHIIAAH